MSRMSRVTSSSRRGPPARSRKVASGTSASAVCAATRCAGGLRGDPGQHVAGAGRRGLGQQVRQRRELVRVPAQRRPADGHRPSPLRPGGRVRHPSLAAAGAPVNGGSARACVGPERLQVAHVDAGPVPEAGHDRLRAGHRRSRRRGPAGCAGAGMPTRSPDTVSTSTAATSAMTATEPSATGSPADSASRPMAGGPPSSPV